MSKNTMRSELLVLLSLLDMGFRMARCDDSFGPYDLISDWHGCLYRLQVKDNAKRFKKGYILRAHRGRGQVGYTKEDCDFIIAPIFEEDVIYIIPVEALGGRTSIMLYPGGFQYGKRGRHPTLEFESYKNAFDLLRNQ